MVVVAGSVQCRACRTNNSRTGERTPSFLVRWPVHSDAQGRSSSSQQVSPHGDGGNLPRFQLLLTPTSGPVATAPRGRRGTSDTTLIGRFSVIWTGVTERTGPRPPIFGGMTTEKASSPEARGKALRHSSASQRTTGRKIDCHRYFSSTQQNDFRTSLSQQRVGCPFTRSKKWVKTSLV